MAYTFTTVSSAFHVDETHPEGYDYATAGSVIRNIAETAVGRAYVDNEGNLVYESRFHREVA